MADNFIKKENQFYFAMKQARNIISICKKRIENKIGIIIMFLYNSMHNFRKFLQNK